MLSQIYSIVLENIFAMLLFLSFMIYYTSIPFSLCSSLFVFLGVFVLLVSWLHNLYNLSVYAILGISFIVSMIGIMLYYVVNKVFTTKYRIVVFLFPLSFLVLFNISKIIMSILPMFI